MPCVRGLRTFFNMGCQAVTSRRILSRRLQTYLDLQKVLGGAVDFLEGLLPIVGHRLRDWTVHAGHAGQAPW
jgi:hypothetical protein